MTDNRGEELAVGKTVAFNFSGEIAVGKIEKITTSKRYGHEGHVFHIRRETHKHHWAKDVSKVTSSKNLLVIHEDK